MVHKKQQVAFLIFSFFDRKAMGATYQKEEQVWSGIAVVKLKGSLSIQVPDQLMQYFTRSYTKQNIHRPISTLRTFSAESLRIKIGNIIAVSTAIAKNMRYSGAYRNEPSRPNRSSPAQRFI